MTIAVLPVPRKPGGRLRHRAARRERPRHRLRRKAARRTKQLEPLRTPAEWIDGARHRVRRPRTIWPAWAFTCSSATCCSSCSRDAAGHRLRQGDLPAQLQARISVRRTCSTATGKTSAPSSRTTRPTSPWPAIDPPFDFHSPEGSSTRACAFCRPRASAARRSRTCLISDGCVVHSGTTISNAVSRRPQPHRPERCRCDQTSSSAPTASRPTRTVSAMRQRGSRTWTSATTAVIERAILDKDCRIGGKRDDQPPRQGATSRATASSSARASW